MTTLTEWAKRWGVSHAALADLAAIQVDRTPRPDPKLEGAVLQLVRLEAAHVGVALWRNNVGAGVMANGAHVRWGLANDSRQLNEAVKSADLIGIRPRLITSADVGTRIGQFVSREVKRADWKYTDNDDNRAQLKWCTIVNSLGGDARIVTGTGSL